MNFFVYSKLLTKLLGRRPDSVTNIRRTRLNSAAIARNWQEFLSPCHTRRRSRGVCVAFLNFLNCSRTPRELQEKMILFVKKASHGVLTASSSRPRRSYGVLTAFCGVLCGVPWSLHDVFTALARRSWRSHRASTAFAPRFHGVLALL